MNFIMNGLLYLSVFFAVPQDAPENAPGEKTVSKAKNLEEVQLKTFDKVKLKADYLPSQVTTKEKPNAGAVLIVHDEGGNRSQLWDLQAQIQNWGASTMVLDLRGHGDSEKDKGVKAVRAAYDKENKKKKKGKELSSTEFDAPDELLGYCIDISTAIEYLRKQKNIDTYRISVVGFGKGGVAAMYYAQSDLKIKGVAMISPNVSVESFDLQASVKKFTPRLVFLLGAESEKANLEKLATEVGDKVYSLVGKGEAQGLELYKSDHSVENMLKFWLNQTGCLMAGL